MEVVRIAEVRENEGGSKNVLRKLGRTTQTYASMFRAFLDLIPNGDYTSVVCGAMKIAFGVGISGHISLL